MTSFVTVGHHNYRSTKEAMSGTDQFAGKVVVLTGAASGIGLASALAFHEQGAALVLIDTNEEHLVKAQAVFAGSGAAVLCLVADVSRPSEIAQAAREAAGAMDQIDVLVNSAGILRWGGTLETEESDWDALMNVNLKGTWLASRAFLPFLATQSGASIVNVASNMGLKGVANQVAYSASKGGVIAMTRSMAVDLGPQGLRVNCIAPGHIRTPMGDSAAERLGLTPEGIRAKYPIGRIGEAPEVAAAVTFLASAEASFLTGAVVPVDGGYGA